jgi:glycosyltransferase involved in cell wall biosynthesis
MLHVINPLASVGGSEMRALELARQLSAHGPVDLWTSGEPEPSLRPAVPVRRITREHHPRGGTLILVGVYFRVGSWIRLCQPERIIIVYNTWAAKRLSELIERIEAWGLPRPEIVCCSELLARALVEPPLLPFAENYGADHEFFRRFFAPAPPAVHLSPVDIERFRPRSSRAAEGARFVVGRLSRDAREKHSEGDPALYRRLSALHGFSIRLAGASCIADVLAGIAGLQIHPVPVLDAAEFLRQIDCFFYRTSRKDWIEPFGRVVVEAMASGLPVVCDGLGGYVSLLEDGRNGFLVENDAEAERVLLSLSRSVRLQRQIGGAARETIERLYAPEVRLAELRYYFGAANAGR